MKRVKLFFAFILFAALTGCEFGMSDILDELSISPGAKVVYDANGAESGLVPVDNNDYLEDATVTVLDNLGNLERDTALEYFIGWNTDKNATTALYTTGQTFQMGKNDVTLYAVWKAGTFYKVYYSATGSDITGTVPTDNTYYTSGQTVYAQNNGTMGKTGYVFKYWNSGSNNYSAGDSFTITSDITLSAVWANGLILTYSVTYNDTGATSGIAPVDSKLYETGEIFGVRYAGTLVKTGHSFGGWSDGSSTYSIGVDYTVGTSNIIFDPVWTAKTCYLIFNANGGTGTMENQGILFNQTAVLKANAFTNSTIPIFTGWATTAAGDAVYTDGASYRMLTEGADLYAAWTYHGGLDKFFGTDGITTSKGQIDKTNVGYSSAVQTDGKIVVAGSYHNGSNLDIIVMRFLPNGELDTLFNKTGYVITDLSSTDQIAYSVAIQTDGKIVVAGRTSTNGSNMDFIVLRYKTIGTLDPDFGYKGSGYTVTDLGSDVDDIAYSLAIQTDGKIVVAGSTGSAKGSSYGVARYTSIGNLDTSAITGFGTLNASIRDGYVKPNIANTLYDTAYSVALQTDGKIVVAGTSKITSVTDNNLSLVRLDTVGTLDTSFSTDGFIIQDIGDNTYDYGHSVAIQADGKIVVAGKQKSLDGTKQYLFVARYTNGGLIDAGDFLKDGIAQVPMGTYDSELDYRYSVAIQADGKIVAAGTYYNGLKRQRSFAVARYIPTGSLDQTFDGSNGDAQGLIVIPYLDFDYATSVAFSDDRIIVAGHTGTSTLNFISVFCFWQ